MIESVGEYKWVLNRLRSHKAKNKIGKHLDSKLEGLEEVEELINNLSLGGVSNCALIDYIETDAEIAMPLEEMFNKDTKQHITKKEYGKMLLKYLVKELRKRYC